MHATVADDNNNELGDDTHTKHIFHLIGCSSLSKDWVLLDNQNILDIHTVKQPVQVFCNAGSTTSNQNGMLGKFGVWYNLKGIASMLSQ